MRTHIALGFALALSLLVAPRAGAQVVASPTLSLDAAKRIVAAAEAEAGRNQWNVAIAVVNPSGELILFHRLDGVQPISADIAVQKARTAARFRRPTKALEDAIAGGRLALLGVDDVIPLEGGIPVAVDGQVVGAIGVSGVTSQQDAQIAEAGLRALQP